MSRCSCGYPEQVRPCTELHADWSDPEAVLTWMMWRNRCNDAADAFAVLGMLAAVYSKGYDDCRDDIIGHAEQLPNTEPRALRWVP